MKTPIEDFINSIYAVTIPMLLLVLAFMLKATSLFYTVLEIDNSNIRLTASIFLGIAVSLTLLTVSVNSSLLNQRKWQLVFAAGSFVMLLFVFKVIGSKELTNSEYALRIFLSLLLSTMEYLYSYLFVKKYQDHKDKIYKKTDSQKLLKDYDRLKKDYENTLKDFTRLNKDHSELLVYKEALKCNKCGKQHTTVSKYKTCDHKILN